MNFIDCVKNVSHDCDIGCFESSGCPFFLVFNFMASKKSAETEIRNSYKQQMVLLDDHGLWVLNQMSIIVL